MRRRRDADPVCDHGLEVWALDEVLVGRSTVELDVNRSRPEDVISAIEQLGYRATLLP